MNIIKKLFSYPKQIYIFYFVSFIIGIEFIGPYYLLFFREWGGLSQFETQLLQSWFMLWIFLLEVPTGVIGDVIGRKFSVLMGHIFVTIGAITYGLFPNFYLFMLGEFLYAIGVAFTSGADEALLYDTVADLGLKDKFGKIYNTYENLKFWAMLLSSLFAFIFIGWLGYNQIFQLTAIFTFTATIVTYFFIKEPKYRNKETELKPDYKQTFKLALKELKGNKSLLRLILMATVISSASYFSIWFYQLLLERNGIAENLFGIFRTYGILVQIAMSVILLAWLKNEKTRLKIHSLIILMIILGFLAGGLMNNLIGIIIFLTFVMGVGLKHRSIIGQFINGKIENRNRATVLSFVSMARRMALVILNPLIGFLADKNLNWTLVGLGLFLFIPLIFIKMKKEDLGNDKL